MTEKKTSFAKEVWDTLSQVDVSAHIQKKMELSYLSWAWAWGELMKYYPESSYACGAPETFQDGTSEIWVTLAVRQGEKELSRQMWLPVMDHRNAAIKNPNARQVSDTRMRCLVKCIAMCGLGHYIYAGEDLPFSPPTEAQKEKAVEVYEKAGGRKLQEFVKQINQMSAAQLDETIVKLKKRAEQ